MFLKKLQALSLASALLLGACASQGEAIRIPVVMPHGEKATIIAHNQDVPDWMLSTNGRKLNFIVRGDVSEDQLKAVAVAENACRIYTNAVRPNELVAVAANGVLYTVTGFIGGGAGATLAFKGAKFVQYGEYNGVAYGMGGIANGVNELGGQTYTFENCGRETLSLFETEYGVHVLQKSPY